MTTPINLLPTQSLTQMVQPKTGTTGVGQTFSKELGAALDKVNNAQLNANNMINNMVDGKTQNLHNVMIAIEKSDIMLKAAVQVRDKVVNAYQDVMRMQV